MQLISPKIRFENATVTYGGIRPVVADLSMDIGEGAFTVFVGPSGCGKTTSLRMINRMVAPASGRVLVDGKDTADVPAHELRRGIGYVIQSAGLFPHRTVLSNVLTVPKLMGHAEKARGLELLERVGLEPKLASRYPHELSGGQQQRVGVARALAADPDIVLMDEPFSAVDPVVRVELQEEVRRLHREMNKTFVMVTHDVDEAMALGDKIAVFGPGGRLAQYDVPERILTHPADDFVAGFVGQDRGFRALGFEEAPDFPLLPREAAAPWELRLDGSGRPNGWRSPEGGTQLGGTLFGPGGSMRTALDAVLSSPSGYGVAVDADGMFLGLLERTAVFNSVRSLAPTGAEAARAQRLGSSATRP